MLGRRFEVKVMIEGSTKEVCQRKVDSYQFESSKGRRPLQFWRFGCKRIAGEREAVAFHSEGNRSAAVVELWLQTEGGEKGSCRCCNTERNRSARLLEFGVQKACRRNGSRGKPEKIYRYCQRQQRPAR